MYFSHYKKRFGYLFPSLEHSLKAQTMTCRPLHSGYLLLDVFWIYHKICSFNKLKIRNVVNWVYGCHMYARFM